MEWITILPVIFGLHAVLTHLAHKALKPKPEPAPEPCQHPWYISGRCIICGDPL